MTRALVPSFLWLGLSSIALAVGQLHIAEYSTVKASEPATAKFLPAVAQLRASNERRASSGSGVFISPRHVLSNAHVTASYECDKTTVHTEVDGAGEGRGLNARCTKQLFIDDELDVTLIEVDTPNPAFVRFDPAAADRLVKPGVFIETFGYVSHFFTHSYYCKLLEEYRDTDFGTECIGGFRGNSGGPTFAKTRAGEYTLIGLIKRIRPGDYVGSGTQVFVRLTDAYKRHRQEFKAAAALAEGK